MLVRVDLMIDCFDLMNPNHQGLEVVKANAMPKRSTGKISLPDPGIGSIAHPRGSEFPCPA
jgi:hypothetical protein